MQNIILTCRNHTNLRWQCKSIAVSGDGSYNGERNIFYNGAEDGSYPVECSCSPKLLTFATVQDKTNWEADNWDTCHPR
jgi:hypothetical protein